MTSPKRKMDNPPLPRHPALQPLSREHFGGLVIARDLVRASHEGASEESRRAVLGRFAAAWDDELRPHFEDEERLLGPLIADPALRQRLIDEHREIERLAGVAAAHDPRAAPDPALCGRSGRLLHDHIRWEERVLFPIIEAGLSDAAAEEIARHTRGIECHRPGARRRSELSPGPPPSTEHTE